MRISAAPRSDQPSVVPSKVLWKYQPFSSGSSVKHGVYGFITYITYMVCYIVMEQNIPLYFFSLIMILGTIIYFTIAVVIVYLKGTKTFKLRQ